MRLLVQWSIVWNISKVFGEDTVPYRRFPTLPAANFPNTEKLYNQLTKQNDEIVIPSFEPTKLNV